MTLTFCAFHITKPFCCPVVGFHFFSFLNFSLGFVCCDHNDCKTELEDGKKKRLEGRWED